MKFRSFLKLGLLAPLGLVVPAGAQPEDPGYFIRLNIIASEEGQSAKVSVRQIDAPLKRREDGGLWYEYELPAAWYSSLGDWKRNTVHFSSHRTEKILAEARECGRKRLATVTIRGPLVEEWEADSLTSLLF